MSTNQYKVILVSCGSLEIWREITIKLAKVHICMLSEEHFDSVYDDPQLEDTKHLLVDISKVREKFRHEPKLNLAEWLKEQIKWFQKQN